MSQGRARMKDDKVVLARGQECPRHTRSLVTRALRSPPALWRKPETPAGTLLNVVRSLLECGDKKLGQESTGEDARASIVSMIRLVYVWTMCGVMKKISSWVAVVIERRLNRLPRYGTLPSNGTCSTFRLFWVWMTPPMTTVPPSVTSTCVVACCVISVGFPCTVRPKSGVVFSTTTFRKIVPPEVICGVTVKRRKAST